MTYYIRERDDGTDVCDIHTDSRPPAFDLVTSVDNRKDAESIVAAWNEHDKQRRAKAASDG